MRAGRVLEGGAARARADTARGPPPRLRGHQVHGKVTREALSPRKSERGRTRQNLEGPSARAIREITCGFDWLVTSYILRIKTAIVDGGTNADCVYLISDWSGLELADWRTYR